MNDFRKGIFYGISIAIIAFLAINILSVCYRRFITKDLYYEEKAEAIYKTMEERYTGDIDIEKMYDGIYTGMVYGVADKYSRYISAEDYELFKQQTEGNYCGIGAITSADQDTDSVAIEAVYDNSPAQKAGIKDGDIIKKVEDFNVNYSTYYDAIDMIRGEENTKFKMTLYRPSENETYTTEITRANVDTPTVAHNIINNDIGYLRITGFEEVTKEQFKENEEALKAKNIKALIIDLRNNPGGLLTTVSEIADEFMSEGVITYTEDKNGKREYVYAKDGRWDIPVVILVNENSASASELLTGALKDEGIAKVVGVNTYGKGVVQTTYPFNDGSALKITTSKYYTPKGVCIDGVGIAPDVEVIADKEFKLSLITNDIAEYDINNDVQLAKAVELIK